MHIIMSYYTLQIFLGIQVPNGIKNTIDLDKKNGNHSRQEAIKTQLNHITDYKIFIILDSGEDIPTGYQKIHYHKARLVAGGNRTVNDKEDIYSGFV
jgi:hypothetical protein